MSSDVNVWERLFKLWASICKLLVDGKRDLEKVASILQKIVDGADNPFVRSIATGKLVATAGKRTLAKMSKLFKGFLDHDFVNWDTDVPGEAKPETSFEVFELVKDGKFAEIFATFGVSLDKLCWSQDQIITFVENHADLLHPKGWATFFLFKVKFDEGKENGREEFFVARVDRYGDGQLEAHVLQLSRDFVWYAEGRYRFVVPQLP